MSYTIMHGVTVLILAAPMALLLSKVFSLVAQMEKMSQRIAWLQKQVEARHSDGPFREPPLPTAAPPSHRTYEE